MTRQQQEQALGRVMDWVDLCWRDTYYNTLTVEIFNLAHPPHTGIEALNFGEAFHEYIFLHIGDPWLLGDRARDIAEGEICNLLDMGLDQLGEPIPLSYTETLGGADVRFDGRTAADDLIDLRDAFVHDVVRDTVDRLRTAWGIPELPDLDTRRARRFLESVAMGEEFLLLNQIPRLPREEVIYECYNRIIAECTKSVRSAPIRQRPEFFSLEFEFSLPDLIAQKYRDVAIGAKMFGCVKTSNLMWEIHTPELPPQKPHKRTLQR